MRKYKILLSLLFVVVLAVVSFGCSNTNTKANQNKITINKSNFKEYFHIECKVDDYDTTEEKGGTALGVLLPNTYRADTTWHVEVYPITPVTCENVIIKVSVVKEQYDIDETITLYLSSNGEASSRTVHCSASEQGFVNFYSSTAPSLYYTLEEADGTIFSS